jgi:hypothetical protein
MHARPPWLNRTRSEPKLHVAIGRLPEAGGTRATGRLRADAPEGLCEPGCRVLVTSVVVMADGCRLTRKKNGAGVVCGDCACGGTVGVRREGEVGCLVWGWAGMVRVMRRRLHLSVVHRQKKENRACTCECLNCRQPSICLWVVYRVQTRARHAPRWLTLQGMPVPSQSPTGAGLMLDSDGIGPPIHHTSPIISSFPVRIVVGTLFLLRAYPMSLHPISPAGALPGIRCHI